MTIDENNYEAYLLCYLDGELEETEIPVLLSFLQQHPDKQRELELLEMTRLPQEKIPSFPDKRSLYRAEERRVVKGAFLRHYGWIGAAAAAVFLALFFIFNEGHSNLTNRIAAGRPSTAKHVTAPEKENKTAEEAIHQEKQASLPAVVKAKTLPAPGSRIATHKDPVIRQSTVPVKKSPAGVVPAAPIPAAVALKKKTEQVRLPREKADTPLKNIPLPEISSPREVLAANSGASTEKTPENRPFQGSGLASLDDQRPVSGPRKRNEVIAMTKEAIDNAITERVTEIQYKVSHPFSLLKGKEVRIGNFSFAFNK
jgi:hypothetical protein